MLDKIKDYLKKTPKKELLKKTLKVAAAFICILVVFILIVNVTLIIKGHTGKENMPSFMGYIPVIVCVDEMEPIINNGDLAICKKTDVSEIEPNDIICYYNAAIYGESVVTKRVSNVRADNNDIYFETISENGDALSATLVAADDVIGVYLFRLMGAGNLLLFMQSTAGLILFVIIPIILFTLYEVSVRVKSEKERKKQTQELLEELNELIQEASETDEQD